MDIAGAEDYLIKADPVLGALIKLQRPVAERPRRGYFESLCRAIVGQQISVMAAATIYGRFENITELKPAKVAALSEEQIKIIGLSKQKASYLKDLAQHFVEQPGIYDHLDKLSDNEVIEDLVKVKGIGVWSAQMFLLFTLSRPDIFAVDDVGLQRAMIKLYKLSESINRSEMLKISQRWSPFRSVACLHLWQSLNNEPS